MFNDLLSHDLSPFFRKILKKKQITSFLLSAIVTASVLLVSACDGINNPKDAPNSVSETGKVTVEPKALNLTAYDSKILIQWNEVSNADVYTLYWSNQAFSDKNSATSISVSGNNYTHSGLANGNAYYYAVTATTAKRESALSPLKFASPITAELDAPTGTIIAVADARNTLNWDNVAGADSYALFWNETENTGASKLDQRIDDVVSPFVHSNLSNGSAYNYIVVAIRENKLGLPSGNLSGIPQKNLPTAPVNVSAVFASGQLSINWANVSNAESYSLFWKPMPGVTDTDQRVDNITSPFTFSPLQVSSQYYFSIVAKNSAGNSPFSVEFNADTSTNTVIIPLTGIAPATPSLNPFAIGDQQITLDWDNSDSSVKGHNIYWRAGVSGVTLQDNKISNVRPPYTHIGLSNNVPVYYIVTAISDNGESPPTSEVIATPQTTKPGVPANVSALAGDTWVGLSWLRVKNAESYTVHWREADQVAATFNNSMADVTPPLVINDLTNGKEYIFAVTALNPGGVSDFSDNVTVTPQIYAPSTPSQFVAAPGNSQVKLRWTAPISPSTPVVGYRLYWSALPGILPSTGREISLANVNEYLHEDLSNGRTLYYVITAYNAGGESLPSAEVAVRPQAVVPEAPQDIYAAAGDESVTISWTAVENRNYNLYFWTFSDGESTSKSVITNVSPDYRLMLPGGNGKQYHFSVSALSRANESVLSAEIQATPNIPLPSQRPNALSATAASTQVSLNWALVSNATAYRLFWSTTANIDPFTSTYFDDVQPGFVHQELNNGASYYYAVAATNAAGIGPVSRIAVAIPQRSTPINPFNLRAVASDGEVALSWDEVQNAESYNLYWTRSAATPVSEWIKISGFQPGAVHLQLRNGATYLYRVSAVNEAGESPIRNQVSVSAKPQIGAPAAPFALASAAGDGEVVLNWQQKTGQDYNLYWSAKPGVTPGGIDVSKLTSVNTFYTHTVPNNGNPYYYVVTAENAGGESAPSEETFAVPAVSTFGSSTNLRAEAGNKLVTLHWQNIADVTAIYDIYWTTNAVLGVDIVNQLANVTKISNVSSPYAHLALNNGQRYYYVVSVSTSSNVNLLSAYTTAVPQINPIGPPKGISVSAKDRSVILDWQASSDPSVRYHIYWLNEPSVSQATGQKLANRTAPFIHDKLSNGIALYYILTAENAAGESSASKVFSATPGVSGNSAPIIAGGVTTNVVMDEDASPVAFALNLTASDVDADILSWSITSGPSSGAAASIDPSGNSVSVNYTPLANFNGSDSFGITVLDGKGGLDKIDISVTVRPVNDSPTLNNIIPAQAAIEDALFEFQFDVDTFSDLDVEPLVYSATIDNGALLPGWLSFDSNLRKFSGRPVNNDVGVLNIKVTADDGFALASDVFRLTIINSNDVPVVNNPIADQTAVQNVAVNFTFPLDTFVDVDKDTLVYLAVLSNSNPLPSWLGFNEITRRFSGVPLNADVGEIEIIVTASDGNGGSASDTFLISIANINDAPTVSVPIPDQLATEDSAFSFTFVPNTFKDIDNNSLVYSAREQSNTSLPSWLTFNGVSRSFSGTPLNSDVGVVTIIVTADDGNGGVIADNFDIAVANINDAPVTLNDKYNVNENSVSVSLKVLANDSDIDIGATLEINNVGVTDMGGSATISTDKLSIDYQPAAGFVGTEKFTYTISDGMATSNSSTVTITINNVNDAPTAVADALFADEDSLNNVLDVLANDTDPDAGTLLEIVAGSLSATSNGGVISINGTNTRILYSPAADFAGVETFSYLVTDKTLNSLAPATVSMTVKNINDAPIIVSQTAALSTREETALVISLADVVVTDIDSPGFPAGFSLIVQADVGTDYTFVGNTITPSLDLNKDILVGVIVSDGIDLSAEFKLLVTVTPVNDAPAVTAALGAQSIAEDSALNLSYAGVFTDAEGDVLMYSATENGKPNLPAWLTVDAANNRFVGTPLNADVGTITIDLTASDGKGGNATDKLVLTVTNTNDAPVAVNDPLDVNENSLSIPLYVLANDRDIDVGDNLQLSSVSATDQGGIATMSLDKLSINYKPAAGFVGTEIFTYIASDGTAVSNSATVTITINNINDAPTAVADALSADEDSLNNVLDVLSNDTDPDAGTLFKIVAGSLSTTSNGGLVSLNAANDRIIYTPAADYFGVETFTYLVTDRTLESIASATVTMTVNNINDAPIITSLAGILSTREETALTITLADVVVSDIDSPGFPVGFSLIVQPDTVSDYVLAGNTITPTPNINKDILVGVKVSDGIDLSAEFKLVVTVTPVNDAPVVTATLGTQSIAEDSALSLSYAAVFTDVDGDVLTYSATENGKPSLPGWLTIDAANNRFVGTPLNADVGSVTIDLIANDGNGGSEIDKLFLTVTNTNDAPVAFDDPLNANENSASVPLYVLANDKDIDIGASLWISSVGATDNGGSATISTDKLSIDYKPAAGFVGTEIFTYIASDGMALSNTATVTIVIKNINDAPTAVADALLADEDSLNNILDVLANDTDPDAGTQLEIVPGSLSATSNGGIVGLNGTNTRILYSPAADFAGVETFSYLVTDKTLSSLAPATVSMTVKNINDAPIITSQTAALSTREETALVISLADVVVTDIDSPGFPAGFSLIVQADVGTDYTFVGNTITPSLDLNKDILVGVKVSDGIDLSTVFKLTVTVTAVNDVPKMPGALGNQTTAEDSPINLSFASVFTDVDGDVLTYSATEKGKPTLPTWLSIDTVSKRFVGTPLNADVGTITIDLTADDSKGGIATNQFDLTVTNTNDIPTLAISDQSVQQDAAFTLQVLANDPDVGDSLTYSAFSTPIQPNPPGNLPGWLSFNPITRTFTGTPTNADVNTYSIDVLADDNKGGIVTATFSLAVINKNDKPVVKIPILPQSVDEGSPLSFSFAVGTFEDPDMDTMVYSANVSGGSLPAWLLFTSSTRSFTGTPANSDLGKITITVVASDQKGGITPTDFDLTVVDINNPPSFVEVSPPTVVMSEDNSPTVFALTLNAKDLDGEFVNWLILTQPKNGTLTHYDPATGSISNARVFDYVPTDNYFGTDSFLVQISDAALTSATLLVNIEIQSVNDAPIITRVNTVRSAIIGLSYSELIDFSDVDSALMSMTISATKPPWLNISQANGSILLSGTPPSTAFGTKGNEVTVKVTDDKQASDSWTLLPAIDVVDAPTVALTSTSVSGIKGVAGIVTTLPIQARDANSNNQHTGGDTFTAVFAQASVNPNENINVVSNNDGTYALQYTPKIAGRDTFIISLGGTPIGPIRRGGNYFTIVSATTVDPSRTIVNVPDGIVLVSTPFSIETFDVYGNINSFSTVEYSIAGANPSKGFTVIPFDSNANSYSGAYVPAMYGYDDFTIRVNNVTVSGTLNRSRVGYYNQAVVNVPFLSTPLRACIENTLKSQGKTQLTYNLVSLTCALKKYGDITSIAGLEYFSNLVALDLGGHSFTDLGPLLISNKLTTLILDKSANSPKFADADIVVLNELRALQFLVLTNSAITDITPLRPLVNLQLLDLSQNSVNSLDPLNKMRFLQYLNINDPQTAAAVLSDVDFGVTSRLVNLGTLYMRNHALVDVSALQDLTNLTKLDISNNLLKIIDGPGGLSNMPKLAELDLSNNGSCLKRLCNSISSVATLSSLKNLQSVSIDNLSVRNLVPVRTLPKLLSLSATGNGIRLVDIQNLFTQSSFLTLQSLSLKNNNVLDLQPLLGLSGKSLTSLDMSRTISSTIATGGRVDLLRYLYTGPGTTTFPTILLNDNPFMNCRQFATLNKANPKAVSNSCP